MFNNLNPACTTGACNPDGTPITCGLPSQSTNNGTIQTTSVDSYINSLCCGGDAGFDVMKFYSGFSKTKTLPYLLYDRASVEAIINGNGNIQNLLVPKFLNAKGTLSSDGISVTWGEQIEQDFDRSVLTAAAAATNIIAVADASRFAINDDITVYTANASNPCCEDEIRATVTAVNPVTNELTLNVAITAAAQSKIFRNFNGLTACGDFAEITKFQTTDYFKSYFQTFGAKIEWTKTELNKCYATMGGVQQYVKEKISNTVLRLYDEVAAAFWLGLNRPESGGLGSQTMGWLTSVVTANQQNAVNNMHDLSGYISMEQKILALINIIEKASAIAPVGKDPVFKVACTVEAYKKITTFSQAWTKVMGTCCMPPSQGDTWQFEQRRIIVTPLGTRIEFFVDYWLEQRYSGRSFMAYMADGLMTAFHPMYDYTNGFTGQLNMYKSQFEVRDASYAILDKAKCGRITVIEGEIAFVFMGMKLGLHGVIQGF